MRFQAVLTFMRLIRNPKERDIARLLQPLLIDRDHAKRRLVGASRRRRHAAEGEAMRRPQKHHAGNLASRPGQQAVSRCCDRAGIDVTGMRRDQRLGSNRVGLVHIIGKSRNIRGESIRLRRFQRPLLRAGSLVDPAIPEQPVDDRSQLGGIGRVE